MPNYYQGDHKALPEVVTTVLPEGGYRVTARLYSYPGPAKEMQRQVFEGPDKAKCRASAQAWIAKTIKQYKEVG